jgi:hypothetical protein
MSTATTLQAILTMLVVLSVGGSLIRPSSAGALERGTPAGERPQVIVFEGDDFTGEHTHIFGDVNDLGNWANSISSMVIVSGTWAFFDDEDFAGNRMAELGPGMYARLSEHGLRDNRISSVRLISPKPAANQSPSARQPGRTTR